MREENPYDKLWWPWALLALFIICIVGVPIYFRVSGDLKVCSTYYKELSLPQCFFSSKTVRIPK